MSEVTMSDMNSTSNEEDAAVDSDLLQDYASMNPFIIYEDTGKLTVAIVEDVKTTADGAVSQIKVRKQGVRKGEIGYKAKATTSPRKVVPVLAFIEESLVDKMFVSPAALALGSAAINGTTTPDTRHLVDMLVEEYEESAPIERQFFNPEEDNAPVEGTDDVTFAGQYTMPSTVSAAVVGADWLGEVVPVINESGSCSVTHEVSAPVPSDYLGIEADGGLVDFNPEVHVLP